jgi:hypothetical protein
MFEPNMFISIYFFKSLFQILLHFKSSNFSKSSPIFRRNCAHLVEKMTFQKKKKKKSLSKFVLWTYKNIFYLCQPLNIQTLQVMKTIPITFMIIQILYFPCDLSNIQKCSLKACPLTWMALLTLFLPILFFLILCYYFYVIICMIHGKMEDNHFF